MVQCVFSDDMFVAGIQEQPQLDQISNTLFEFSMFCMNVLDPICRGMGGGYVDVMQDQVA